MDVNHPLPTRQHQPADSFFEPQPPVAQHQHFSRHPLRIKSRLLLRQKKMLCGMAAGLMIKQHQTFQYRGHRDVTAQQRVGPLLHPTPLFWWRWVVGDRKLWWSPTTCSSPGYDRFTFCLGWLKGNVPSGNVARKSEWIFIAGSIIYK